MESSSDLPSAILIKVESFTDSSFNPPFLQLFSKFAWQIDAHLWKYFQIIIKRKIERPGKIEKVKAETAGKSVRQACDQQSKVNAIKRDMTRFNGHS